MDSTPFSNNPSPALFFLNPSTLFWFHFLSLWPEFLFFTKKNCCPSRCVIFCMSHRRREFFCRANLTYLLKWSPVRHTGGASSLDPLPSFFLFFQKRFHPFLSHRGIISLCSLFLYLPCKSMHCLCASRLPVCSVGYISHFFQDQLYAVPVLCLILPYA